MVEKPARRGRNGSMTVTFQALFVLGLLALGTAISLGTVL